MLWTEIIGDSIQFIEEHISENITVEQIAKHVHVSPYYFQKGFSMMCGVTVSEYIRNRKLTLAGNDIAMTKDKIIDIAFKYGYDSPDSFTKAFYRFHNSTPSAIRNNNAPLKLFAPLKIRVSLEGGNLMDYKIETKEEFKIIGCSKTFTYENAKTEIPVFWKEHFEKGNGKIVCGEFGVNIDEQMGNNNFEYIIADLYKGQEVPEGFFIKTVPSFTWAVFPCKGALPDALQNANALIFSEWLPAMKEYEFAAGYCIEMYDDVCKYANGTADADYYCEIWIPIKKKQ